MKTNVFHDVTSFENMPSVNPITGERSCHSSVHYQIVLSKENRTPHDIESALTKLELYLKDDPRYFFSLLAPESYMVYDQLTRNRVQVSLERNVNAIMLYPFRNCKVQTMEDLFTIIHTSLGDLYTEIFPLKWRRFE